MTLNGNYTALVTPFNKNSQIDYISLKNLCKFQLLNNSNGIVALGSTAEACSLDIYEKHKIMEAITNEINGKIPIIAGINTFSLSDALYQATSRFLDGANALLISPPPYIKPTQNGLKNFFLSIADQSLIPVILYNIPSRTSTLIDENLVSELSNHPNIIGLKDAGGDIVYTQQIIHKTKNNNFNVLAGNDNQLYPILSLGGTGIISVVGNVLPNKLDDIINFYNQGKLEKATEAYYGILNIINSLSMESNPIPIKYLMSKLGLIKPYYRAPLCLPTKKTRQAINNILNKIIITKI